MVLHGKRVLVLTEVLCLYEEGSGAYSQVRRDTLHHSYRRTMDSKWVIYTSTLLFELTRKGLCTCSRCWGVSDDVTCHHLDGVHSPSLQPTEHCAGGSRLEFLRSGATAGDCSHCVPSEGRSVVRRCGRGPCDSDGRARGSHGGHTTR